MVDEPVVVTDPQCSTGGKRAQQQAGRGRHRDRACRRCETWCGGEGIADDKDAEAHENPGGERGGQLGKGRVVLEYLLSDGRDV